MAARSTAVVHIPAPAGGAFTKAQKDFNRLSKRVQKLEKELAAFRRAADDVHRRVQTEYRPLQTAFDGARAALVPLLDAAYRLETRLATRERTQLRQLLATAFADLPAKGYPALQAILDRYATDAPHRRAPTPVEEAFAEATPEELRALFEEEFGIRFDPAVDISTPEKFQAYADQLLAGEEARQQAEQAAADARRAARKESARRSARELAADARRAEAEKVATQAVRAVYRDLVKALHPDRERDEAEKTRKTALLQQVTAAYERNELLTLLRLQLELNGLDPAHLETLADAQLVPYNQLLREQVRELEQTLFEAQVVESQYADVGTAFFVPLSAQGIRDAFAGKYASLQQRAERLAAHVAALEAGKAGAMKAFLKTM